ncbi:MAG: tail fiber domain-containing protein, partial [Candidatus Zixiibacteriota bacterium]
GTITSKVSIGPGHINTGADAFVAGNNNRARGTYSVVGGGGGSLLAADSNAALGDYSAVGGGRGNVASGFASNVRGGQYNKASDFYAAVGGGTTNSAGAEAATVGGGRRNSASAGWATVGGGNEDTASGIMATVGGGGTNLASGDFATVPGGAFNKADGAYSFAAGLQAQALHDGSFVWSDATGFGGIASTAANQFLIQASGGVGIGTTSPQQKLHVFSSGTNIGIAIDGGSAGRARLGFLAGGVDNGELGFKNDLMIGSISDATLVMTSEKMRIKANGNVGIGTTTPTAKLEVLNSASSASTQQGVSGITSNASTGSAFGGIFTASSAGTGIKTGVRGNASSASANPAYGVYGEADNSSTGDAYGGFFNVPSSGGTGASYGVYSAVASSNGWGFYTPNNAYLGGNVGIGATSPQQKLHVFSSGTNIGIAIDGGSAGRARLGFLPGGVDNGELGFKNDLQIGTVSDASLVMTSEKVRITNAGNVGIGTAAPTEKLHVVGNICATGTIGACSDVRFKRDVRPVDGSLDKIEKLQGVTYRWKREEYPQFAEGNQIGFVAQDVKEILPEVVSEGSDGTLSVDYGRFSVVLLEAIKEQQKEIKELKAAIEKLQVERR